MKRTIFQVRILASWILAFVFAVLLTGNSYSATRTITSLPYTVPAHSTDTWDTLVISGTKLTSQKSGIIFGKDKAYWVVKLDDDTLEFGVNIADTTHPFNFWTTAAGIYLSSGCSNIIIEGGYILHTPRDASGNLIDTSTPYSPGFAGRGYNHCISAREYPNNMTIRNVREARIRGIGGINGTSSVLFIRGKMLTVSNCRFYNDVTAFRNRCNFESTVIAFFDSRPQALNAGEYHFRVENSYLESNSHGIINANSDNGDTHTPDYFVAQIEACSLKIDTRNDQYTSFSGGCKSTTNGYGIYFRSAGPNTYVRNNYFYSGDKNNGGRGMMLLWSNGTPGNEIDISGNYMDIHEGSTVEHTPRYYVSALKLRQQNHYVDIHDNVFVTTFDTSSTSMQGYTYMGSAVTIQLAFSRTNSTEPPYYLSFVNNVCSSKVVTAVGNRYEVSVAKFESASSLTEIDTTFVWKGNQLYSNGNHIYDYGQFDDAAQYILVQEDTVFLDNSKGLANGTFNVGFYLGSVGNVARDNVYLGAASDTSVVNIFHSFQSNNSTRELDITLERTMRVLVRGGIVNDTVRPVINAACSVFTAQGQLVLAGVSDSGGMVFGPVAYYKSADVAGDTDYNPFTLRAWSGSDFTEHTGFTVGWTNQGGTDTLTLLNTTGTGDWGKGGSGLTLIDTSPPARIRINRFGFLPAVSPGTISMAWTATGDDGNIGQAKNYRIVYSTSPITEGTFNQATEISAPPLPSPAGQTDSVIISNLVSGQLYHIAIKAYDEAGNASLLADTNGIAIGIPTPLLSSDTIILDQISGSATLFASSVMSSYSIIYDFDLTTGSDFSTAQRQTITSSDTLISATFSGLDSTTFYTWRARAVASDRSDSSSWSTPQTFSISGGIAASNPSTTAYAYPNPVRFTQGEMLTFILPDQIDDLVIYSISGDQVHYAHDVKGQYIWDGRNDSGTPVASGVYLWFTRIGGQKGKIVIVT